MRLRYLLSECLDQPIAWRTLNALVTAIFDVVKVSRLGYVCVDEVV